MQLADSLASPSVPVFFQRLARLGNQRNVDSCRNFLLHSYQKMKTSAKRPTCRSSIASLHSSNKSAHRLDLPNRIMADLLVITDAKEALYQVHKSPNSD